MFVSVLSSFAFLPPRKKYIPEGSRMDWRCLRAAGASMFMLSVAAFFFLIFKTHITQT